MKDKELIKKADERLQILTKNELSRIKGSDEMMLQPLDKSEELSQLKEPAEILQLDQSKELSQLKEPTEILQLDQSEELSQLKEPEEILQIEQGNEVPQIPSGKNE